MQEFSDNFISLYANSKLGIFNILPIVGKNKLQEVYIAGQLHIDLFEETNLPDMALSNRQGYKSDDERYEKVLEYVKEELLPGILKDRSFYSELLKAGKKRKRNKATKEERRRIKRKKHRFQT